MKTILILLIIFQICFGQQLMYFNYKTLETNNTNFQARLSASAAFSVPLLVSGASYSSLALEKGNNSADINGIHGSAYQIIGSYPVCNLAYFDLNSQFTSGNNHYNFDTKFASSYMASLFKSVLEIDPNGNIVRDEEMNTYGWTITNISSVNSPVKYVVFQGIKLGVDKLKLELTFIIPSQLMSISIINTNDVTIVSPKALEILVGIDASQYNYKSASNHLRLVNYVLTGSTKIKASVSTQSNGNVGVVTSGSGQISVNYRSVRTCTINGGSRYVDVSYNSESDVNILNNTELVTQVKATYSSKVGLTRIQTDFPPNADLIYYDPTLTVGEDPAVTSSSSVIALSFTLLFLIFFF